MDEKDPGAWQRVKGKANEVVGDILDDPERKEKGRLQEKASEGKAAQSRLLDEGEKP